MPRRISNHGERGSTMAEFAVVALVFFTMIVGVIEFGRLLYTHNALTDATRRGARYAVLHSSASTECVERVVVYGEANLNSSCEPVAGAQPLISGLSEENVKVTFVGADLDNDPSTPPTAFGMNLGTATVEIGVSPKTPYQFTLSIPAFRQTFNMPVYSATLTSESAGTKPNDLP